MTPATISSLAHNDVLLNVFYKSRTPRRSFVCSSLLSFCSLSSSSSSSSSSLSDFLLTLLARSLLALWCRWRRCATHANTKVKRSLSTSSALFVNFGGILNFVRSVWCARVRLCLCVCVCVCVCVCAFLSFLSPEIALLASFGGEQQMNKNDKHKSRLLFLLFPLLWCSLPSSFLAPSFLTSSFRTLLALLLSFFFLLTSTAGWRCQLARQKSEKQTSRLLYFSLSSCFLRSSLFVLFRRV